MPLTQSLTQMTLNVRRLTDTEAATARHPDADIQDYINRGLGAFHRILTMAVPDQRVLQSSTFNTAAGTSTYALPADFDHLISIDLKANGAKAWLMSYEMYERAALTDGTTQFRGIPFSYRLRGDNIEMLPQPDSAYQVVLWYVPSATQLTTGGEDIDTISRLDDFPVAYAGKLIGIKDKNWDLVRECKDMMAELRSEIELVARARDKNSPSKIVDEMFANRWGRRAALPRRWR